jgi:hypothetical protein
MNHVIGELFVKDARKFFVRKTTASARDLFAISP